MDQQKKKLRITALIFALLVIAIFLGYHLNYASPSTLGIIALALSAVAMVALLVGLLNIVWRSDA